jgi:hypothetical protein
MRTFQPCPLCGNCQFFRRSEKDRQGVVLEPADCAVGEVGVREDTGKVDKKGREIGAWSCEGYTRKKNGQKKTRKIKPWQQQNGRR